MPEPTLAELFNIPLPDHYEFAGKKYPAREATQVEQGLFVRWLEAEAAAFVERQTHLPATALEKHRAGLRADAAAGKFNFYSAASLARQSEIDGAAKLLSIKLLADGFAECTHEYCTKMLMAEAEATAKILLEQEAAHDPKAVAALNLFQSLIPTNSPNVSPPSNGTTSSV